VSKPVGFDTGTLPQLFQWFAGVIIPCQNEGMEIGYARVSRGDSQDIDPQLRALRDAGCDPIYQEEASGGRADRPELARAIGALKAGDVFVVWKLDRPRCIIGTQIYGRKLAPQDLDAEFPP
jgi:hypothetical protein